METTPTLYGRAVTADDIAQAVIALPSALEFAKWYAVGVGVLLLYVAVKVSKR